MNNLIEATGHRFQLNIDTGSDLFSVLLPVIVEDQAIDWKYLILDPQRSVFDFDHDSMGPILSFLKSVLSATKIADLQAYMAPPSGGI